MGTSRTRCLVMKTQRVVGFVGDFAEMGVPYMTCRSIVILYMPTCPGCADLSSRGKGVQGVHQSASECPRKIPKLYGTCEYCGWDHGSPLPILAVSTVLGLHCLGAIQISQPLDQLFNPLRGSHHRRIGRKSTNKSSQSGNPCTCARL